MPTSPKINLGKHNDKNSILDFAKTLSGQFSNREQSQNDPKYFAHINIFFIPINWSFFEAPGFYSEQSYDYDPWAPYRQGVHKLIKKGNVFVVKNYQLSVPQRFAGSGSEPSLLDDLTFDKILRRQGCDMHFKELGPRHYLGQIQPGRKCIIPRGDKITYLMSHVEINDERLLSLDEGYEVNTNHREWGSEHGPLQFKRVQSYNENITENWPPKV